MQATMLSMSVIGQPTLRLKESVIRHETMIGKCTHVAADGIYPTNENRTFLREKMIQHNFCRKGRGKDDKATKQMKGILNKERSKRLESDRRYGQFW